MTIKKLKELITDLPDEMKVLIPAEPKDGFTGAFFSPCDQDSMAVDMGTEDLEEDEMKEMELLNKEIPSEKSFVLVPCGYYDEHDNTHEMN
jgi:hypothetical protein